MSDPVEAEVILNGTFISENPTKKFGLVQVKETTYLATKDPEHEIEKGTTVVVAISNVKEPKIL